MRSSFPARSAIGSAALLLAGLLSGCNAHQDRVLAVELASDPAPPQPSPPAGTPAAKGRQVRAVAAVRSWIAARNEGLATGDRPILRALAGEECRSCARFLGGARWTILGARVTQHTVDSATVAAAVAVRERGPLALEFEVTRVAEASIVTQIATRQ